MKKLFKINSACDRFEFFQKTMMLFVMQLIFALVFWVLTTYTPIKNILWIIPLFLIFIELPLLYIYFVLIARRMWSILGAFKLGIIAALVLFILSVAGFLYSPILVVLIYLMLLLVRERDLNA